MAIAPLFASLSVHGGQAAVGSVLRDVAQGDGRPWALQVDCVGAEGIRGLRLVGNGVGVWDVWTQIEVPRELESRMAGVLLEGGFLELKPEYGGRSLSAPEPGDPPPAPAQRVVCRIVVEAVDATGPEARRTSVQYADGEQSEALTALANRLLDLVQPQAADGVTPGDRRAAFRMLNEGVIDPRLLEIRLVMLPSGDGSEGESGVIVRLNQATLTRQAYLPGREIGEVERRRLSEKELNGLVAAMAEAGFMDLPINLWSDDQLELSLAVLGHRHAVQARQFSKLANGAKAEEQTRFLGLVQKLADLASVRD